MEILPRLYERDIDVLLQEEIIFNGATRALLSNALKIESLGDVDFCQLSVVDLTGETDLLVSCSVGSEKIALLIENKIDAVFQPRQAERYRERSAELTRNKKYSKAFSILVAPSGYVQDDHSRSLFDAILTYEHIADSIVSDDSPRARHRALLLRRAVQQARKSYVLIPTEAATEFWKRIYAIASNRFPELKMVLPGNKGSSSSWISFKSDLPKMVTIDWKISKGSVDLSFWPGSKIRPSSTVDLLNLPEGSVFGAVGKGGTLAVQIPQLPAPTDWTTISDDQVFIALQSASKLLSFFHDRISLI